MSVKVLILDEIVRIADQQKKILAPLDDNLALVNSGLDSLCVAILVASLDDQLGIDPFEGEVPFPVTLGEFIALYENAPA